jgi:hypothetical protein
MCRFDARDLVQFLMILLPFMATSIAGTIRAGYGWYLFAWLAYSLLFFFLWEAFVLCRHCPLWAAPGRILHCHANYGIIKIWKPRSRPMSRSDRIQFVVGTVPFIAFPFPFLLMGKEYLFAVIWLSSVVSGVFLLRRNVCTRCVNFSCPLNMVPKELKRSFFERNPQLAESSARTSRHAGSRVTARAIARSTLQVGGCPA